MSSSSSRESSVSRSKRSGSRSSRSSRSRSSSRSSSPGIKQGYKKSSSTSKGTMKNFMYDNKNYKESNVKKCVELANEDSDHEEVWILKIPKSVDVTELVGAKINLDACEPIKKTNLDFYSERNKTNRTMSLITPRKLAGSEIVSDSLRLIKPVGFARVKRTIPTIYPYDIDDLELPEAEVRPVLTNKKKKSSPTKKLNEPIAKNSSREEVARKSKRKNDCSSGEESNQPKAKKIKLPKPIKIKKEKTESSDELSWLKDVLK